MCGVAGGENAESLLEELEHRGFSGSISGDDFCLAHRLHPVVGHVEQPLEGEGELSANCEIYNWRELAEEHGLEVENDAELLLEMLDRKGAAALEELDGVYALAYLSDGKLLLARDLLGVKPLWYATDSFAFASERQALERAGRQCRELHPRMLLRYDLEGGGIELERRDFFEIEEESMGMEEAAGEVLERFRGAVSKRVPEDEEVALLFSGGLDSTMVAAALQELDADFTCYTSWIQHGNVDPPRDLEWAEEVSSEMGLELESRRVGLGEVEEHLPELADWISSTSAVKLGVALPFHFALEGDEKVAFSGLGSEQLYAGYARQQRYLNRECLSDLRSIFHRDLYRDDVVTMRNGKELRLPFLDHGLVRHALRIPPGLKRRDGYRKYVLRKAAERMELPEKVVWRDKTAAQYGSNFDKALDRLASDAGSAGKQEYLNSLRQEPNNRLVALTSGGKDSNAALYRMKRRNCSIECLLTLESRNPDSYMFDTETQGVEEQAENLEVPLMKVETDGEKEEEVEDLVEGLEAAREKYGVEGVVSGALASAYQRDRVERASQCAGLKVFAPLWNMDQENYLRWLVSESFQIEVVETAARGLDSSWEGRVLDSDSVEELISLSQEHGFQPAGEGGAYETVVRELPQL